MSTLCMRLKQRARVLAAGVVLSAATLAILPSVAEAQTNDFGDQNAEQTSQQSIDQSQENTQVSAVNVAAAAPVAVAVGGDANNGDANAQAGAFSEQDQQASNDADQAIGQEQNAGDGSYSGDCNTQCPEPEPCPCPEPQPCPAPCSHQPTYNFGDQNAVQASQQSIDQNQENTQVSLLNIAAAAPVAVGGLGDANNGDATAQAGAFSEQNQEASNEANQRIVQIQEVLA